jgi:hypothetical protein
MYLPEYRVVVCIECKHAVLPSNINTHLRDKNMHNMPKESRGLVVQEIQKIQGLIISRADLNRLVSFPVGNPPILVL